MATTVTSEKRIVSLERMALEKLAELLHDNPSVEVISLVLQEARNARYEAQVPGGIPTPYTPPPTPVYIVDKPEEGA